MGLFSKLVKGLKKTIRGIGKAIKKVTKPIRKVVRKVLKPFGRIYNKLGWVGSLALMFALPAMAGWMGKWFQTFSQWATKPGVADWLTNASKALGNWSKTSRLRFDNITTKIKEGFNNVTGRAASEAGATAYPGGPGSIPIESISEGAGKSWWQEHFGGQRIRSARQKVGTWMEDRPLFGQAKIDPATGLPDPKTWTTGMQEAWKEGIKGARSGINPESGLPYKIGDVLRTPTITGFTDVVTPKIASVRDVVGLGEAGLAGQQIYTKYFKDAKTYEAPFYNANTSLANAMMGQTEQTSPYMEALQFVDPGATEGDDFYTLSRKYASGWGKVVPEGTNPVQFAMNLPGYGYNLEDYYWDTIYGDQETSDLYDPYNA